MNEKKVSKLYTDRREDSIKRQELARSQILELDQPQVSSKPLTSQKRRNSLPTRASEDSLLGQTPDKDMKF